MWRGKQSYIENKKEQEQPYPPIGLSHTSDETEVATGKIEAGSDFTHSTGTQNLPLSDDNGTNNINEAWEATNNPQSAEDKVAQHDAYRRTFTTQYVDGDARLGSRQGTQATKFSEQKVLNHRRITNKLREEFLCRVEYLTDLIKEKRLRNRVVED